jgi:large subunit ribosomal protein L10
MNKEQKSKIIDCLTNEFKVSKSIVICDYKGLSHKELEDLRREASNSNTKVQVAKNTLVKIAVRNSEFGDIELSGSNIFLWSDDQISACKVADNFYKLNKDKFEIKSGIIEGEISTVETINKFAKLSSKEELIGMLLSIWTAPLRYLVTGLDNLKNKKDEVS